MNETLKLNPFECGEVILFALTIHTEKHSKTVFVCFFFQIQLKTAI